MVYSNMGNKSKIVIDKEFQELAIRVNNAIIENDGLIGDQKEQVELLYSLERKFQYHITRNRQCAGVYKKFVDFIVKHHGNMLSANPFFREKTNVFNKEIIPAIRNSDIETLMGFDINFQLINFIVNNWKGKLPKQADGYYRDVVRAREVLIENNLPLAINRAKLFFRKSSKSHLDLLDLIGICTYGLISGIDKYVGSYTKVWRSVCIGRMVGYMIDEQSKTFLRMYPTDKKILYRANSLKYRLKIEDIEELTKAVNESFYEDQDQGKKVPKLPIHEMHIRTLLNGSSYISTESNSGGDSEKDGNSMYDYTLDPTVDVEYDLVKKDTMNKIIKSADVLSVIEKKIIALKGVVL